MTYRMCKQLIALGKTEGLSDKIDLFLLAGKITEEQYSELIGLIKAME